MTTQQKKLVDGTKISLYDQEVWDRNTVADGVWLQSETLEPISANDRILASAINHVSEGVDRLTGRIDSLTNASDVIDVYGDWDDFTNNSGKLFDTSAITDNDIIKVLNDKNAYPNPLFPHAEKLTSGHQTYFRWSADAAHAEWPLDPTEGQWEFIGHLEPYYNITEIDDTVVYLSETIDNAIADLSAAVSDNYLLSDENGVIAGKNIRIDYDQDNPKITVKTEENVEFDSVSAGNVSATGVTALTAQGNSAKFTNLSATNLNDIAINNFFGSAYSGAAASAYITAHGDDLLNSSHSAYGILTFGDKEFQATGSNYNFKFNAGPGIGFTTGINQVTISAEGTTYSAGNYISTAAKTISVTGDLITSAGAGSAASAWINSTRFDYSYFYESPDAQSTIGSIDKITVLYKNDVDNHDAMRNQEIVFERDNYRVSGLLIQAATNDDDGKVLTYDAVKNIYAWKGVQVNNGNYVSASNAQKITLASATTLPSPTAMATGVYYIV